MTWTPPTPELANALFGRKALLSILLLFLLLTTWSLATPSTEPLLALALTALTLSWTAYAGWLFIHPLNTGSLCVATYQFLWLASPLTLVASRWYLPARAHRILLLTALAAAALLLVVLIQGNLAVDTKLGLADPSAWQPSRSQRQRTPPCGTQGCIAHHWTQTPHPPPTEGSSDSQDQSAGDLDISALPTSSPSPPILPSPPPERASGGDSPHSPAERGVAAEELSERLDRYILSLSV